MILHISNGERGYLFRSKRWQSSRESSNNEYLSTYAEHSNFVLYVVLYLKSKFQLFQRNIFTSDFDYIEDVKGYAVSSRKKPMLVDQRGYIYTTVRFSKNSPNVYWRCQKRDCRARAVSLHNKIIHLSGTHDHSIQETSYIVSDRGSE